MPQEIRVTIGFEESYQESLDFLEAMFRECRKKALQEGNNTLAAFVGLRLEVLEFQRAYAKERVEFLGDFAAKEHKEHKEENRTDQTDQTDLDAQEVSE